MMEHFPFKRSALRFSHSVLAVLMLGTFLGGVALADGGSGGTPPVKTSGAHTPR